MRIRGGTARSYYVGIETAGLAVPGAPRPLRALCVVPFGMEEGSQIDVPQHKQARRLPLILLLVSASLLGEAFVSFMIGR